MPRAVLPLGRPGHAWCAVALALGLGSAVALLVPSTAIDWQPALAWRAPWRAWSAAFVHYSALHLAANAAGLLLVAALGAAMRAPRRLALAWLAAWPLTQLGLLAQPALLHYGGLSGVLHAGVAAAALHLAWRGAGGERWIGAALLIGLVLKVLGEAPWGAPLRHPPGWDIAVAPAAHACGLVAGTLCAIAAELAWRRPALPVGAAARDGAAGGAQAVALQATIERLVDTRRSTPAEPAAGSGPVGVVAGEGSDFAANHTPHAPGRRRAERDAPPAAPRG